MDCFRQKLWILIVITAQWMILRTYNIILSQWHHSIVSELVGNALLFYTQFRYKCSKKYIHHSAQNLKGLHMQQFWKNDNKNEKKNMLTAAVYALVLLIFVWKKNNASRFWEILNFKNKVSLCTKYYIINP